MQTRKTSLIIYYKSEEISAALCAQIENQIRVYREQVSVQENMKIVAVNLMNLPVFFRSLRTPRF